MKSDRTAVSKAARAVKEDWPVKLEITAGKDEGDWGFRDPADPEWTYEGWLYVQDASSGWHKVGVAVSVYWEEPSKWADAQFVHPRHPALQTIVSGLLGKALDAGGWSSQVKFPEGGRRAMQRRARKILIDEWNPILEEEELGLPMSQHQRDKQAYMDASPMQREAVRRYLCDVLAVLRAQYLAYQTSHWMVVGGSFYGNHLLFERLYKSVQEQVDQLAEKIMGYLGGEAVALTPQLQLMVEATRRWEQAASCLHLRGLASESDLQHSIKTAYDGIKAVGSMTLGLDDWLMATANAHEENTYLLQQVKAPVPGQDRMAAFSPRKREDLIGYFYALHDALEKEFNYSAEQIGGMTNAWLRRRTMQLSDSLARTDAGDGAVERAMENAPAAYKQLSRITGGKLASDAPSAEGDFYKDPEKREVLEFARSNAISNSVEVTEKAVEEDHLDIPEAKAVAEAEEAPLLPTQIAEEPGGKAVGTLNRYVLFSEDPDAEKAVSMNKKRMAAWCGEVSDAP